MTDLPSAPNEKQHDLLMHGHQLPDHTPPSQQQALMLWQQWFNQWPDPAWLLDSDRIVACNEAAHLELGYLSAEHFKRTRRSDRSPMHQTDGTLSDHKAQAMYIQTLQQGVQRFEWTFSRADGSTLPAEITMSPLHAIGHSFVCVQWRSMQRMKQQQDKLVHLAGHDSLTGLPNRVLLHDRLTQALNSTRRRQTFGALLFLDLDHFKRINDSFGHRVGDTLIKATAQRLQQLLRTEDTLARMGGDEMLVLLPSVAQSIEQATAHAWLVAQKLLQAIGQPFRLNAGEFSIGASMGCTVFPKSDSEQADDLIRESDTAMYEAKNKGRGLARQFSPDMHQAVEQRFSIEQHLKNAIANHELQLHLQGKWNAQGRCISAEVLLRWLHPQRGMVSPLTFIPVAEDSGLILSIGKWVIEQACAILASPTCQQRGLTLAVNVSPRQFKAPDFSEHLIQTVQQAGIAPSTLILELTENLLIEDMDASAKRMHELDRMGFRFSIDDFGTGYSSLLYLKRLPIQELKIDRAFVKDIGEQLDSDSIVDVILTLAQRFGMSTVAEGVETEQQAQWLLDKGCTLLQGYLYGKPMPVADFFEKSNQHAQITRSSS